MKYFIKHQLFCLFIGPLLFFSACNGKEGRTRNGHSERRAGRHLSCPEAGLSEEQQAQIRELRQSFRGSENNRNRGEKGAAHMELNQSILATVPETEQQRAALSECFERRQNRH